VRHAVAQYAQGTKILIANYSAHRALFLEWLRAFSKSAAMCSRRSAEFLMTRRCEHDLSAQERPRFTKSSAVMDELHELAASYCICGTFMSRGHKNCFAHG